MPGAPRGEATMNTTRYRYRFAIVLLAGAVLAPACARRAPVVQPVEDEKAPPPAKEKAPEAHRGPVAFGATGCPIAVMGPKVWGLKNNKEVRQLQGADNLPGLRALSATGK